MCVVSTLCQYKPLRIITMCQFAHCGRVRELRRTGRGKLGGWRSPSPPFLQVRPFMNLSRFTPDPPFSSFFMLHLSVHNSKSLPYHVCWNQQSRRVMESAHTTNLHIFLFLLTAAAPPRPKTILAVDEWISAVFNRFRRV